MQFRLLSLLILITVAAFGCAILFALPIFVSYFCTAIIVLVSPSVWFAGVYYSRGRTHAFFMGGLTAGAVPFIVASYYSVVMPISMIGGGGSWAPGSNGSDSVVARLALAAVLLLPGVFSCLGGGMSMLTHWLVIPRPHPTVEPQLHETPTNT